MKKRLLALVLTAAAALTLLSGCSLFAVGGDGESGSDGSSTVKITDSFTFEDPADLEFDARYVLRYDENSAMVSGQAAYGMLAYYVILYAKEEQPVGRYEFYVCDTAENLSRWLEDEQYSMGGRTVETVEADAAVMQTAATQDGIDELEGQILLCEAAGIIREATVSAYADFVVSSGAALVG